MALDPKRVPYLIMVGGKNSERPSEPNLTMGYIRQLRDNETISEEILERKAKEALDSSQTYVEAYIYKLEKVVVRSIEMTDYKGPDIFSKLSQPPQTEKKILSIDEI